jgi:acetyl-CoA carboxylase biotin carboxyl carrier protein
MADNSGEGMKVDTALVRELAQLLADSDLSEIEVEDANCKIRVSRQVTAAPVAHAVVAAAPAPAPVAAAPAAAAPEPVAAATDANAVPSPMVGTVYLSPEPTAGPFKKIGDAVKEGDTVLIIEAMKVMNTIVAPRSGTLTAMLVENGQPVEYDQPLFVIA